MLNYSNSESIEILDAEKENKILDLSTWQKKGLTKPLLIRVTDICDPGPVQLPVGVSSFLNGDNSGIGNPSNVTLKTINHLKPPCAWYGQPNNQPS